MRSVKLLILILLCGSAFGSISHDADSAAANGITTGTSLTWNHVMGSCSNSVLIVLAASVDNTANRDLVNTANVTWNGTAMKYLGRMGDRGGSELFNYAFILVAPASGTHAVVINYTANVGTSSSVEDGAAVSFCAVNQTYPYRLLYTPGSGTTNSASWTITDGDAVTGDYVVGSGMSHKPTIGQDVNNSVITTQPAMNAALAQGFAAGYRAAASGTSLAFTQNIADVWSGLIIAIRPDTATPTQPMFENAAQSYSATGTLSSPQTFPSFVAGGCARGLLVVGVNYTTTSTRNITAATWNSLSLTKLDGQRVTDGAQTIVTELWYLKNPGAATSNISFTLSATFNSFVANAVVWCSVDQSSTFGSVAKTSSTAGVSSYSVTVTSTTGSVVQGSYWIWPDSFGYVLPDSPEQANVTVGASGTGATGVLEAKAGVASAAIGGIVSASGGGIDYNAVGVGINYGAAAAGAGSTQRGWVF